MNPNPIALQKGNVLLPRAFLERMIKDEMHQEICEVFQLLSTNPKRAKYMEIGINESKKIKTT